MTAISTRPRFGLAAGSTRGLLAKILLLAVVAAIACGWAVPLVAARSGSGCGAGPGHRGHLRRLPAAVAHPDQVHRPGHDLPDRLPGGPGRVDVRGLVHELRRWPSRLQGRCDPAIEASSVKQVPGSAQYILTIATTGDVATGNLVFLLYDPATKVVQAARRGPHAVHDCDDDRDRQGHRGGRPHDPQHRPGGARSPDIQAISVPTDKGAIKASGREQGLRGTGRPRPTTLPATASRTRDGRGLYGRQRQGRFVNADRRGPAPGLAGERRPRQLHPGLHRLLGLRAVPRHPRLELRVRDRDRAPDVLRRPARGGRPELAAAPGAALLSAAHRAALRHAVVRDAAGLARHVQHGLRADQQPHRRDDQLVRRASGPPGSRSCSSSSGSATRTCSWSVSAPCSRSRRT